MEAALGLLILAPFEKVLAPVPTHSEQGIDIHILAPKRAEEPLLIPK